MPAEAVEKRAVLVLAAAYLALALLYSWVIPPLKGPDEPRHYNYVKRLVEKHALPRLEHDAQGREVEADGAIVFHPPLYYLLLSPVYVVCRPLGDAATLRVMRCLSPFLIGLALALFHATLRRLYPARRALRLGAVGAVAFLPHIQMEAGLVNNDVLAIVLGALLLWQLARIGDDDPSPGQAATVGLVLAAFVNTKAQGLTVSPLWALWLLCHTGWRGLRERRFWLPLACGYLPLLTLGSPWYLHNQRVYGLPLLIAGGSEPSNALTGRIFTPAEMLVQGLLLLPLFWMLVWRAVGGLYISLWAQVGWFPDRLATGLYALLGGWLAAGVAGNVALCRDARRAGRWWWQAYPRTVRFACLAYGLVYLNIMGVAVLKHVGWYQGGRYTLPTVYGLVLFVALGLERLAGRRRALVLGAWVVCIAALNVFCVSNLVSYLIPRFTPDWHPFG
jgi:hypothetical protein